MRIINRQQVSRLAIMPYPIACGRKGKANHQQAIKEFEEPDQRIRGARSRKTGPLERRRTCIRIWTPSTAALLEGIAAAVSVEKTCVALSFGNSAKLRANNPSKAATWNVKRCTFPATPSSACSSVESIRLLLRASLQMLKSFLNTRMTSLSPAHCC